MQSQSREQLRTYWVTSDAPARIMNHDLNVHVTAVASLTLLPKHCTARPGQKMCNFLHLHATQNASAATASQPHATQGLPGHLMPVPKARIITGAS
jgi:hypothetical protein